MARSARADDGRRACTVTVKLKPGARQDAIQTQPDGSLKISVTSPPVEGRANEHLVKLLARKLRIPRSGIAVIKGQTSRIKVLSLQNIDREGLRKALA